MSPHMVRSVSTSEGKLAGDFPSTAGWHEVHSHDGEVFDSPVAPSTEAPSSECLEGMDQFEQEGMATATEETIVEGLAAVLEHLATLAPQQQVMTFFHSRSEPPIGIRQYLARLRACFACSIGCYVVALVYIDRLVKRCPALVVSKLSCHRLLLGSLLLASKFHDDHHFSNKFYAKAGGLVLMELNTLESRMLQLLQYKLFVSESEYKLYSGMLADAAITVREPPVAASPK